MTALRQEVVRLLGAAGHAARLAPPSSWASPSKRHFRGHLGVCTYRDAYRSRTDGAEQ